MDSEEQIYYTIEDLVKGIKFYYKLLDYIDLGFYNNTKPPFTRADVLSTIQAAEVIKNRVFSKITHPSIKEAILTIDYYQGLLDKKADKSNFPSIVYIGFDFLYMLIISVNNLIAETYIGDIELKISAKNDPAKIRFLIQERQKIKYNKIGSTLFLESAEDFLNNRISDFQELIELDKSSYSVELKEIIQSYLRGVKVNIKGKDLLTPLLKKEYKLFIESFRNLLFIPSCFDITQDDKERIFHIYLLGVLEGRMILYNIKSNKETGSGRYDIGLIPINNENPGVIIEIKKINNSKMKKSLKEALSQIKENEYCVELRNEGISEILIISVVFERMNPQIEYEIITGE